MAFRAGIKIIGQNSLLKAHNCDGSEHFFVKDDFRSDLRKKIWLLWLELKFFGEGVCLLGLFFFWHKITSQLQVMNNL